jgi:hypothetical protein
MFTEVHCLVISQAFKSKIYFLKALKELKGLLQLIKRDKKILLLPKSILHQPKREEEKVPL